MAETFHDQEALLVVPPGGWTVDHLDALPATNVHHELTDGALTVSPSPSNLHQVICLALGAALTEQAPEDLVVTQAVEIRFDRRLTRIPDVLVVRTDDPCETGSRRQRCWWRWRSSHRARRSSTA